LLKFYAYDFLQLISFLFSKRFSSSINFCFRNSSSSGYSTLFFKFSITGSGPFFLYGDYPFLLGEAEDFALKKLSFVGELVELRLYDDWGESGLLGSSSSLICISFLTAVSTRMF